MWSDGDFNDIDVPTENRYFALYKEEMAREGFQNANKRKRANTGQSDSENRSIFMLSSADDKLNVIFDELLMIRKTQEKTNKGMLDFQKHFQNMGESVSQVVRATNKNTDMIKTLAYKSIDQEARSRRNNLIFWGLAENYYENCFALIREFIKHQLDLDSDKMYLARAHRLGPRKNHVHNQKRPIIVNFRDFCDIEIIMSNANMLRNTPFSVDHDVPKEINMARKVLWTDVKSIKARNPKAKCQIVYPAKLIVDGKVFRDEFPDWATVMMSSRLGNFTHIDNSVLTRQRTTKEQPRDLGKRTTGEVSRNLQSMNEIVSQARDYEMSEDTCSNNDCSEANMQEEQFSQSSFQKCTSNQNQNILVCDTHLQSSSSTLNESHVVEDREVENTSIPRNSSECFKQTSSLNPTPLSDTSSTDNPIKTSVSQAPIFRPFNTTSSSSAANNKQTTCSNSEIPERGRHASRSTQRGTRRAQSVSVPRYYQDKISGTSRASCDETKNPTGDKNRQASGKNSSQNRISDDMQRSSSRTPHGSKNRQNAENCVNPL